MQQVATRHWLKSVTAYALVANVLMTGVTIAADLEPQVDVEEEYLHHVAVILGNTHTEEGEDAFTFGLDYEYRLSQLVGIGLLGEYAVKDIDAWVVGVPFALHPFAGWRLVAMPGVEIRDHESEFLFRTGVGYEFEFDQVTFMPEFNADFVNGETNFFFGTSIGVKF